jgi:hypothetical protein
MLPFVIDLALSIFYLFVIWNIYVAILLVISIFIFSISFAPFEIF